MCGLSVPTTILILPASLVFDWQEEQDKYDSAIHFWKYQLEKACEEKNVWVKRSSQASSENDILRAELFLVQQDAVSARRQLEVARHQLDSARRLFHSMFTLRLTLLLLSA